MARTQRTEAIDSGQTSEAQSASNGADTAPGFAVRSARKELPAPISGLLSLPKWLWMVGMALLVGSVVSFGDFANVPEDIQVGSRFSHGVDSTVDYMVVNWDPFFSAINKVLLLYLLKPLEDWLVALPWWLVVAVVALISYRMVSPVFAGVAVALMMVIVVLGLFLLAMSTLALLIVATLLTVAVGVPVGILAARSNRFDLLLRPALDAMQTMPSFVYLIPVLMLFGLGKVPAVLATMIYSTPPIIRLTNLGIRQVDASVIEAARAFGTTSTQLLVKVQFPLALPTIMAGLNQTIMMALAMVVIASMIGAKGLGVEVLNGISRLDVGRGLVGGIGILIMAIIIDRITQGFAKSQQRTGFAEQAGK